MIRPASPQDLERLADIEDAADGLLTDLLRPSTWLPAPPGALRAAAPGFLLVAVNAPGDEAIGFVHVLQLEGQAHLEQLSVLPAAQRRGHGTALVAAALAESGRRGHDRVTLRTFSDIPFNAPFYERAGFQRSEPDTPFLRSLVEGERRIGLLALGRRVQMTAALGRPTPSSPPG